MLRYTLCVGVLLFAQCGNAFAKGVDFAFGIGKFLSLAGNHGLGRLAHESLVAEFLLDRSLEALEVFQVGLELFQLLLHIDVVSKRNGILGGSHEE